MRIHLATWPPEKQVEQTLDQASAQRKEPMMKLRILLSYWYYKDIDLDALFAKYFTRPYPDVFADSGAFSAATQGARITVAEYAAWVKRWRHLFATYSNLDSIGNPTGTAANQAALEAEGLSPLPVFHVSAKVNYDELEKLCERYSYVALGGMVPYMRTPQKLMPHLIRCFRIAQGRTVFHGFGCTSWTVLKALPWYSVDSSSWGMGFRFGQVPVFNAAKGRFVDIRLGDRKEWGVHASLVRSLGFDPNDFADRSRNDRAKICALSAISYMKAEAWLRKRHGEIHIPGNTGAPEGVRAHLADANPQRFNDALMGGAQTGEGSGLNLHLSDTSNGINYGDAEKGLRLHLADARGHSGSEIASADAGFRLHQSASSPGQQSEWRARRATQEAPGLRVHLVEHSLDKGGVGDISRAMEVLNL